jgi:carboxyl-terminal processing protease
MFKGKIKKSLLSLLILITGAFSTWHIISTDLIAEEKEEAKEEEKDNLIELLELFAKSLHITRANYVEEISDKKLIESAINGMLSERDPHSGFLNEEDFKDMETQTEGKFGGLGIVVTMEKGAVKVISPIDDTPAAKKGVKAGDLITHLDGEQVQGLSLTEAVRKMRGPKGTKIKLTIFREENGEIDNFDVTITRDIIKVDAVKYEIKNEDVGYLRITTFNKNTFDELEDAIEEIQEEVEEKLKGYVIDLRNNPGGLLDQAEKVSDTFLTKGEIVTTKAREEEKSKKAFAEEEVEGDLTNGKPLVVIINGGSASASEIVAGALQDHRRAVIVGTKSFGKGSVQTIIPLSFDEDGAPTTGMKITTARYYTPSGTSIQADGIEPDIEIKQAKVEEIKDERRDLFNEATLHNALKNDTDSDEEDEENGSKKDDDEDKKDYQLNRAIDILKGLALYKSEPKLESSDEKDSASKEETEEKDD